MVKAIGCLHLLTVADAMLKPATRTVVFVRMRAGFHAVQEYAILAFQAPTPALS